TEVFATGTPAGDVDVTLRFADGSVGTVTYAVTGDVRFPKETFDASARGHNARLDNFRRATLWTGGRPKATRARGGQDKGQRAQLRAFIASVREEAPMPIPFDSLLATTRAT